MADGDVIAECGPASVSATFWGEWTNVSKAQAIVNALAEVRGAAALQCSGSCPDATQSCRYRETASSVDDVESRINPDTNQREWRAKATSKGTCACS